MPTWDDVIKKYGKDIANKMKHANSMQCITCHMRPDGKVEIPQRDIDNAYDEVMGKHIPHWRWD